MKNAVLSYGLGVDSTAIFLRWVYEPETRPCALENIAVISAMTGDEFLDTGRDVTNHILPLMREHRIRYVQVARHGPKEDDGITVLSDTRSPEALYLEGDYKLSDELAASGVVPSYSGAHVCSMKSKAVPIEKWLDAHYENATFGHAFGYNAEEPRRVQKSDDAFRVRNVAFGFNAEEVSRVERAKVYDTSIRLGFYPLVEWRWGRQACLDYIREKTGILWSKSACVYCPFAHNKANLVTLEARHIDHPQQTADALMLERMSLALNPRGTLYRAETLMTMTRRAGNTQALGSFNAMLAAGDWALYRVRRLYGAKAGTEAGVEAKKGTVQRAVEKVQIFPSEDLALAELRRRAIRTGWELVTEKDIHYAFVERRGEGYPAREEYFVVAPARVEDKTRYGIDKFNAQWTPVQYAMEFTAA
jgi:hypothetical protein